MAPLDDLRVALAELGCPDLVVEPVTMGEHERLRITRCWPDGGCRTVLAVWVAAENSGLETGVYSLILSSYWNQDASQNVDGRRFGGLSYTVTVAQRWVVERRWWDEIPRE